ncbi:MAG: hypothetical protein RLT05_15200 [Bauldia litoralis]
MADKTKTEPAAAAKEKAPDQAAPSPAFRTAPSPAPVDDSFADGVSGFTVGRNVLKLDMYRIVGYDRESGQEVRTHSHRLVLPLTAIAELSNVLQQFDQAVSKIRASQDAPQGDGNGSGKAKAN